MVCGYPPTDAPEEDARAMRYVQLAVFAWWPEHRPPDDVLPRRLGAEALERKLAGGEAESTAAG